MLKGAGRVSSRGTGAGESGGRDKQGNKGKREGVKVRDTKENRRARAGAGT